MVAMLSARSAGPYMPDMPMAPRPMAETVRAGLAEIDAVCIVISCLAGCRCGRI